MSNSQVISFRASGHFLNWIEAQREEGESPSQAAMRVLKVLAMGGDIEVSTPVSTSMSTRSNDSLMSTDLSTDLSTDIGQVVDSQVAAKLDPVMERLALVEERLGKLRA
ncbi:hypothetical protein [Microcoleus sp. B3-D7]|uniref:hypothetical protein n=1 Tax=Microcoleus sp. B3-D7 TaxID=2818659 RepID=UPI002FD2F397